MSIFYEIEFAKYILPYLSMGQTFKTWGLLELVNSVSGLAVVLILSLFI